jgi:hypothetical protein
MQVHPTGRAVKVHKNLIVPADCHDSWVCQRSATAALALDGSLPCLRLAPGAVHD